MNSRHFCWVNSMKDRKKPAIRFKGFTEDWEQRKLGEIAEIRRGLTYKPDDVKTSGIRVLRSSNINEEYFETYKDDIFVDEIAINIPYVKNGDIIITSANGSTRLVGKHAIIKNIPDNAMVHGGFMLVASTNEPEFLNSSMSSPWYVKFINIYVAGGNGAIGNLSKRDLDNQEILVPYAIEQQKIGIYFQHLDNLITLHQRKYDKLVNVKKSMLEKMFPKNGESIPDIRFSVFTEAWEQRKLGEICQVTMGQSPDGSTYSETPSDYILVQGNADLKDGWVSPRIWTTQKTKTADAGDLIMSVRAPAGAMGKTTYNVVIGRGVAGIKGNEYIYQYLVKMDLDSYWKKLASGSTFESIKSEDINRAELMMPRDIDEQDRIGEYFRNLNHLITLHQRKLEKLKNIKKSCLEKMFI